MRLNNGRLDVGNSPHSPQPSLRDHNPQSVGTILHRFPSLEDDTLGEMIDPRSLLGPTPPSWFSSNWLS